MPEGTVPSVWLPLLICRPVLIPKMPPRPESQLFSQRALTWLSGPLLLLGSSCLSFEYPPALSGVDLALKVKRFRGGYATKEGKS